MADEMNARFLACITLIINRIEGGYVNDPQDPGGETKYGISKASYPNLDIAGLTFDQAAAIYYSDYWAPSGASALAGQLDLWLLDGAINHGVDEAVKLLQRVCGVAEDGALGPETANAAIALAEPEVYLVARANHYMGLPGWPHDKNGWMKRLFIIAEGC
jgi:lysozyme family protein